MLTREQFDLTKTLLEQACLSLNSATHHWRKMDQSRKILTDSFFDYAEHWSSAVAGEYAKGLGRQYSLN